MSSQSPFTRRGGGQLAVPRGDVLGEYETYSEAQGVIDRLAKADFAVKGLAIVGSDLITVERVTGRLSYARAALTGAASGAWIGSFFGLVLFLFSPDPQISLILAAGLIAAGFGMTFGIVSYAINRRRRDFRSTSQVLAGSYRIIIEPNQTARARNLLSGGASWPPPLPESSAPAADASSAENHGQPDDTDTPPATTTTPTTPQSTTPRD